MFVRFVFQSCSLLRARGLYERVVSKFPTAGRYWRLYIEHEVKVMPTTTHCHLHAASAGLDLSCGILQADLRKRKKKQFACALHVCVCVCVHACACFARLEEHACGVWDGGMEGGHVNAMWCACGCMFGRSLDSVSKPSQFSIIFHSCIPHTQLRGIT